MVDKAKMIARLGRVPVLSDVLRWQARRYREGSVVTIRSGIAAGMKWRRFHRYLTGYWAGHYELPVQQALQRELAPGRCFYDVGCNAGFFSLVAARIVGQEGRVVSFDPDPDNCAAVRQQRDLNGLADQWSVEQVAVADRAGVAVFERIKPGSPTGRLLEIGNSRFGAERTRKMERIEVQLTTLDEAVSQHGAPDLVKMDIEGAEVLAMRGAERLLSVIRPIWFIEAHGPESEQALRSALLENGYVFVTTDGEPIDPEAGLPRHFIARPT